MEGMQQTISWLTEAVRIQEANPSAPFIPFPEEDSEAIIAYLEFSRADINTEQHRESAALLKKIIPVYSSVAAEIAFLLRQAIAGLKTRLAEAIELGKIEEIVEDGEAREHAQEVEAVLRELAEDSEGRFARRSYCEELFSELADTLKECDAEILRQRSSFQAGEGNRSPCVTERGDLAK